jgi:hypothetical protein
MKEGFQYFEISNLDTLKMYELINSIQHRLKKNKQVVAELEFHQLLLLLKPFIPENYSKTFLEIESVTNEVVEYCKKEKEYNFIDKDYPNEDFPDSDLDGFYKEKGSSIREDYAHVSLRTMVNETVRKVIDYLDNTEIEIKDTKSRRKFTNEFIGVCYKELQNYKINHLNKKLQKQLSHYKLTVITGLITIKIQPNLISKFEGSVIDNKLIRPDDIKETIVAYTNKFVKKYLLKK